MTPSVSVHSQLLMYVWAVQLNLTSASYNTITPILVHARVLHDITGLHSIGVLPQYVVVGHIRYGHTLLSYKV